MTGICYQNKHKTFHHNVFLNRLQIKQKTEIAYKISCKSRRNQKHVTQCKLMHAKQQQWQQQQQQI